MAKPPEIKTISYVHIGEELVNTDDLTQAQKSSLATWLKLTYLNNLFMGKAKFRKKNKRHELL